MSLSYYFYSYYSRYVLSYYCYSRYILSYYSYKLFLLKYFYKYPALRGHFLNFFLYLYILFYAAILSMSSKTGSIYKLLLFYILLFLMLPFFVTSIFLTYLFDYSTTY